MTGRGTVKTAVETAWGCIVLAYSAERDSLGDPLYATRGQWRSRASDSDETPRLVCTVV